MRNPIRLHNAISELLVEQTDNGDEPKCVIMSKIIKCA